MRIAVMGTGFVARLMCSNIQAMKNDGSPVELYAVASRSTEKAEAFARRFHVQRSYGSYEAMLEDPMVELVYIATPHVMHAEHMKLCIRYGKPILCEKPFTVNRKEAEEVLKMAHRAGVFVADGLWARYFPACGKIRELISQGAIGEPYFLKTDFITDLKNKEYIVHPEMAGGSLLTVGVYPISFTGMIMGYDLEHVESSVTMMESRVDLSETMFFCYKDGREAQLSASVAGDGRDYRRHAIVYGTNGHMIINSTSMPSVIHIYESTNPKKLVHSIELPPRYTGYEYEIESCMRAISKGQVEPEELPHHETLKMMEIMDHLRAQWNMRYPFENV